MVSIGMDPLWSLWHIIDSNFFPLYVESNVSGKFLCSGAFLNF